MHVQCTFLYSICMYSVHFFIAYSLHYVQNDGTRANDVVEIRPYTQMGIKPVDINHEVWDIYGEEQMSLRMICRWVAKFRNRQELKEAPCNNN